MYEIPKIHVPVVLHLVNGESISGKLFVTDDLVSAGGNPQVDEFLNEDPDLFFSFQSDAGAYRLINKAQLAYVETDQDDSEVKTQTVMEPRSLVLHFSNEATLFGQVYPMMAEESRVSDILNQEDDFIVVYRQATKFIVNRRQIVYVNAN